MTLLRPSVFHSSRDSAPRFSDEEPRARGCTRSREPDRRRVRRHASVRGDPRRPVKRSSRATPYDSADPTCRRQGRRRRARCSPHDECSDHRRDVRDRRGSATRTRLTDGRDMRRCSELRERAPQADLRHAVRPNTRRDSRAVKRFRLSGSSWKRKPRATASTWTIVEHVRERTVGRPTKPSPAPVGDRDLIAVSSCPVASRSPARPAYRPGICTGA